MTRPQHIYLQPKIIPARVSIHHLQLRDLLQPAGVKGRVLFVNRLKVEQVDFNTLKPPTTYCSLDFLPNCLTTASGLLAAGGQHSELALRPLYSANESERYPAPWQLRTPTGGSINNAISIHPDNSEPPKPTAATEKSSLVDVWARDEPRSSSDHLFSQECEWETDEEEIAAAYGIDLNWRRNQSAATPPGTVRLMVSNNDQSIKCYKLRPPQGTPGAGGRIESGLPGLSKTNAIYFPTAINHSSLSPDQRTLLSVGDTPQVFLYNISRNHEFTKVATYTASSDASFSTTWSPDGTKFAVASQDGAVSVWDVRSSRKLASLMTSQSGMPSGNGAARVVKFSPHGDMLAFTEHRNFFHIFDTVSFSRSQKVQVPSVASLESDLEWHHDYSVRETSINVSGLCWDPDGTYPNTHFGLITDPQAGDFIYASTERLIARYSVLDSRQSWPSSQLI